VVLCESCGDPHDGGGLKAGRIGYELSKVRMISALELVFDQDPLVSINILTEQVCPEWTDLLLLCLKFQWEVQRVTQQPEVGVLR
jgi:hypothetical protein